MRRSNIWLIVVCLLAAGATDVPEFPHLKPVPPNMMYLSEGFRLGYVLRMAEKGIWFWRYRYEGQLQLGFGTNQGEIYDTSCFALAIERAKKRKRIASEKNIEDPQDYISEEDRKECLLGFNPFNFSFFSDDYYEEYDNLGDGPVVIFYQRPLVAPQSVFTDTKTYLRGIWPANPNLKIPKYKKANTGLLGTRNLTPLKSTIEGRIIGASVEDVFRKTYEITVQLGNTGNNFKRLSLADDPEMFDYIVKCMMTGKMLRIEYTSIVELLRPLNILRGYWTNFRIIGIQILD